MENKDRFPQWFRETAEYLSEGSSWLYEKRGPAIYGDEVRGIPASGLFDKKDAEKALKHAGDAIRLAYRLFGEFYAA